MKKYIYPVLLSGLCFGLVSCGSNNSKEGQLDIISIETAIDNKAQLQTSDCFKTIRYIPLETNDSCLVGENAYVKILNDKLIVRSGRDRCQVFDKQTGRFICQVGHVGNDPEGYSSISGGWTNPNTNQFYFPGWNKNFLSYKTDGTFDGNWEPALRAGDFPEMAVFTYLGPDVKVGHYSASSTHLPRVALFRDNEVIRIDSLDLGGEKDIAVTNNDILSLSIVKDGGDGLIIMNYKDQRSAVYMLGNGCFWHNADDLYFKEPYNDTIYQVSVTEGLVPVRVLDAGRYAWPYADRFAPKGDVAYPTLFMENEDIIFFRFVMNASKEDESRKTFNALYRKADGTVKVSLYDDKLVDDLNGFLPLQPQSVSSQGEFVTLLSAGEIVTWFEEHGTEMPESVKALKQVGEEDNPVVVIMESAQ